MGVGNPDYGDDGFGVQLAEELAKRWVDDPQAPHLIHAGAVPERYLGTMTEQGFDTVVFLDAVEFGGEPGSVVVLDTEEIAARLPQVSTHKISLGVLAKWIEGNGTTKVRLLGVQPQSLRAGEGLTPTVHRTLEALVELWCESWSQRTQAGAAAPRPVDERLASRPFAEVQR